MPLTPSWLQSLLEEHFEELQMLWELRLAALHDPDYTVADLAELDERLEAHVDGLVLAGEHAHGLLLSSLEGDERAAVFAAAYALLCCNLPAIALKVVDAFRAAQGEALLGFCDACCHGPITHIANSLRELARSGPLPCAPFAAQALMFHRRDRIDSARIQMFLNHDDPLVRCAGWRLLALSAH